MKGTHPITRRTPIRDLPELLKVPEAAAWLDISPWSVYDLARRGILPSVQYGRNVRIVRAGLLRQHGHQDDGLVGQK
jgi:excisionase family DNA binding protein